MWADAPGLIIPTKALGACGNAVLQAVYKASPVVRPPLLLAVTVLDPITFFLRPLCPSYTIRRSSGPSFTSVTPQIRIHESRNRIMENVSSEHGTMNSVKRVQEARRHALSIFHAVRTNAVINAPFVLSVRGSEHARRLFRLLSWSNLKAMTLATA